MDQLPQHFLYPDPHTPIQGDLQVDPNLFMQHSHNQHCQQRYEELLSKVAEMERKFAAQIWNVQCWHCSNPQHLSPMSLQQPGIQTPSNSQHLPPTYQQQPDTQTPSQPKRCSWCRRAKEAIVSALKRAMSLTKLRASQGDDASAANTGDAGSRMLQRMKAENNFEWPETPSMLTESGMWSKASGKLATKSQPAGPGAPAQFGGYDPAELHTSFYDLAAAELEGQYLPQPAELACESRRSLQHKSSMIAPHRVRQSLPLLTKPTAAMNTESFAPSSRSSHTISSLSFPTPIQYGPLVSEALTESPIEYRNLPPTPIEQVASGSLPVRCGTGDSWKSSGSTLVAYEEPNNSYLTNQLQETQWSGKQDASLYTQGYQNDSESYTPRYGPDDFPKHPAHSRPGTWAVAKPEPRDRAVLQQGISSGIQGYGNHVGDHSRGADSSAFFSVQLSPDGQSQITGVSGNDCFQETKFDISAAALNFAALGNFVPTTAQMNSRKDSWDSTSTIIGPAVSEYQPHSSVKQPTSRQVTDQPDSKYRPKSRKGGSRLQLPSICIPCNFEPKKGPDQRKKMERHMKTARHREKVGEEEKNLEEYLCEMCQRIYNRRDNFRQHQKACRHRSLKIELANEDEEFELENQETTSRRTSAAYGHDDAHGDASGRLGRCLAMDEGEGIFSMSSF